MKFKLDENTGRRGQALLTAAGHDVSTVFEQKLSGADVLELPSRATPDSLLNRLQEFLLLLAQQPLGKELWIVEPGRVRIHQPDIDEV